MAIQGTRVPMYTYTHCFSIFLISFQIFFFNEKQNKAKTENKQTKTYLNKVKHKTRLTQKQESKTHK